MTDKTGQMQWISTFKRLVRRKRKTITHQSYDVVSRRIEGEMGGDAEFSGFRAAILYFQLSSTMQLDESILLAVTRELKQHIYPNRTKRRRFATLFLNNEEYGLIHPRAMMNEPKLVIKEVLNCYQQYAKSHEMFAAVLKQSFPGTNIYSRTHYPSSSDICILFHDRRGIALDPTLKHRSVLEKRALWIGVDQGSVYSVSDKQPLL